MQQSAWNTAFGRVLIIGSLLSAIGGCVWAASLVGSAPNDSTNLSSSDSQSFSVDMNATDMNAGAYDEPASEPLAYSSANQDQPISSPQASDAVQESPESDGQDQDETEMNATEAPEE